MNPLNEPQTRAGRSWLNEECPANTQTEHTQQARRVMAERILAIEREAQAIPPSEALRAALERIKVRSQSQSLTGLRIRPEAALSAIRDDVEAALATPPASGAIPLIDVDLLARAYTRVRGAHNSADSYDEGPPCDWCRLAAEQHIQAIEVVARLASESTPVKEGPA